jgi:hypothetical protein
MSLACTVPMSRARRRLARLIDLLNGSTTQ